MTAPAEVPLLGGNMTAVHRVGATVRRTAGPWSATIQRLLAHLRGKGLLWVPEPLGFDERGREVLAFVPGVVPIYPLPEWVFSDRVLEDFGRKLRKLHDASADFDRQGAVWRQAPREPGEVICHNDLAPHNATFEGTRLTGFIDFDECGPGPRLWDLAHVALRTVPLFGPEHPSDPAPDPVELRRRCVRLLAAYGSPATLGELLGEVVARLEQLAEVTRQRAVESDNPELHGHAGFYIGAIGFVRCLGP
ncbi:MAG: phosphotransferase enzyme family protein [Candidatus Nanopelagicales bacterium]